MTTVHENLRTFRIVLDPERLEGCCSRGDRVARPVGLAIVRDLSRQDDGREFGGMGHARDLIAEASLEVDVLGVTRVVERWRALIRTAGGGLPVVKCSHRSTPIVDGGDGVDEHEPGNVLRMVSGEDRRDIAAERSPDENERTTDLRDAEEREEVVAKVLDSARPGSGSLRPRLARS